MQERFQDAKIGVAQLGPLGALLRVLEYRLKGFHENEPDVHAGAVLPRSCSFPLIPNFTLTQIVSISIYFIPNKRD